MPLTSPLMALSSPRSQPEVIDIDAIVIDTPIVAATSHRVQAINPRWVSPTSQNNRIRCHGFRVQVEPGHSFYSNYPFNLHAQMSLPWLLHIAGNELFLYAEDCLELCYADPCINCAGLKRNTILCGILQRMTTGAKEHTPYKWLSHSQLEERTYQLGRQVNSLKLHALNT